MKQLLFIASMFLLVACGSYEPHEPVAYDITYIDGSHEVVALDDELKFADEGDCITTCGCSTQEFKRCGVRKFDVVHANVMSASVSEKKEKRKDTLYIKLPTNLKH